jgi:two-component system KDP operon response regulator KdpE
VNRVLVVDDEPQIRRALRTSLEAHGYEVQTVGTGEEAVIGAAESAPELMLLDLGLPDLDGTEVIRRVRGFTELPIIVLSVRDAQQDKVAALDAGADDYVTKPFGMDELMARIRATLRRVAPPALEAATIEAGDFSVDLEARTVEVRGTPVRLTPKEFELLVFLIRNAGKVLTHQVLLKAVWGGGHSEQVEYLRVFVGQLRKKVELDPSHPAYVLTEPWIGYRFDPGDRR